jgi:hypothetical protein
MFSTRTQIARSLIVALVAIPGVFTTGCIGTKATAPQVAAQTPAPAPPPAPQRSGIRGRAKAETGVTVTLGGLKVTAHKDLEQLRDYLFAGRTARNTFTSGVARVSGNGFEVSWDMNIPQGTYYVVAWMDVNNDGLLSNGDVVGIVGQMGLQSGELTPVTVWEGEMADAGTIYCELFYGAAAWLHRDVSK